MGTLTGLRLVPRRRVPADELGVDHQPQAAGGSGGALPAL